MSLDTKDKTWIDSRIERSHKKFQKDTNRYLLTLLEHHKHEMLAMKEFMSEFPTRTEVREIVHEAILEETPPIIRTVFREEFLPYLVTRREEA